MANPPQTTAAAARMRGLFIRLPAACRRRPRLTLAGAAATLLSAAAAAGALFLLRPADEAPQDGPQLEAALAALDAGEFQKATDIATELRVSDDVSYRDSGGPLFVIGAATLAEARLRPEPSERLYLVAARYLATAKERGFPPGREAQGRALLGESLLRAGLVEECLPELERALELAGGGSPHLHALLAEAGLYSEDFVPGSALAHIDASLDSDASAEQREERLLLKTRIQLAAGRVEDAAATWRLLPPDSPRRGEALLLKGELILAHAAAYRQAAARDEGDVQLAAMYDAAEQTFRQAAEEDTSAGPIARQASFLLGIAARRRGRDQEALEQFVYTRQRYYNSPEALAAQLEEADMLEQMGDGPAAVEARKAALAQAAEGNTFTPLVSKRRVQTEALTSFDRLREAGEFSSAVELAGAMPPIVPADEALELKALAQRQWGEALLRAAGDSETGRQELEAGRARLREAGRSLQQLARLRYADRRYPDHLRDSGLAYLEGHDFAAAERMLLQFLRHSVREDRPLAQVSLGEAQLSLGKVAAAEETLSLCVAETPRHVASYRARIVLAQAKVQGAPDEQQMLERIQEAKQLLLFNLEQSALRPVSPEWRDSLLTLGELLFREGTAHEVKSRRLRAESAAGAAAGGAARDSALDELKLARDAFLEAARRLGEGVERYPESPSRRESLYLLAESHRRAARYPAEQAPRETIESSRLALLQEAAAGLAEAEAIFERLISALAISADGAALDAADESLLRNCYFGRANSLFDQGRYEEAIAAYSSASSRYHDRPAALEAMMQIALCYQRLGKPALARGALARAKVTLSGVAEESDFQSTTRFQRREWERFLGWLTDEPPP